MNDTILNVINSYEERPFGSVLQMALNYAIGHLYNQGTDQTSIFCAELVAITYQALGLLDTSHPPNWYSPNSFGPNPLDPIPWLQGVSLAAPIELSVPNDGGADVAVAIDVEMTTWPAGSARSRSVADASCAEPPVNEVARPRRDGPSALASLLTTQREWSTSMSRS